MTHELSDAEKLTFKNATARRREAGIRLKRFSVMLDADQIVSVNSYWSEIVQALGKQKAGDYLVVVLREAYEVLLRLKDSKQ